jgi:imidazolonepropionase-like amidohydrolase
VISEQPSAQTQAEKITLFTNFQYIDPIIKQIRPNLMMLVQGQKILDIGQSLSIPEGVHIVNLSNCYVVPGLINIHCHLSGSGKKIPAFFIKHVKVSQFLSYTRIFEYLIQKIMIRNARETILHGITTVRSLGEASWFILKLRDLINQDSILGLRIFTVEKAVCGPKGHGSLLNITVDSVESARNYVHEAIERGVDVIKLIATGGVTDAKTLDEAGTPQLDIRIISEICRIAHAAGLKVAAHCQSNEGADICIEAGVDSLEHGSNYEDSQLDRMKKQNIATVPTLLAPHAYITRTPKETGLNNIQIQNTWRIKQRIDIGLQKALNGGILVGAGTDAGIPMVKHSDFYMELILLNKNFGMSPMDVIRIATLNNTKILGFDHLIGSLEPGKYADFLCFFRNPIDKLEILAQSDAIYKGGKKIFD